LSNEQIYSIEDLIKIVNNCKYSYRVRGHGVICRGSAIWNRSHRWCPVHDRQWTGEHRSRSAYGKH